MKPIVLLGILTVTCFQANLVSAGAADQRTSDRDANDSYQLPFKFTGTIDEVTYQIGPEQLTAVDREKMQRAIAAALDTPTQ